MHNVPVGALGDEVAIYPVLHKVMHLFTLELGVVHNQVAFVPAKLDHSNAVLRDQAVPASRWGGV